MINIKACEIEIELDVPVEISREGDTQEVTNILFKQPNRRTAHIYEEIVTMFNRGMATSQSLFKDIATEEQIEEAKKIAAKQTEKGENNSPIKSLQDITFEEIMEEVEGSLAMMGMAEFNFEKGYKLFDRMLLGGDKRSFICYVGGKPVTDGMLEKIDYRDYKKMLVTYIVFFGKPVKAGTMKDSALPQDSAMPVKEL